MANELHRYFCRKTLIEKTILRVLGSREFSHGLGHFRKSPFVSARSALPPGADIVSPTDHVRLVPKGDMAEHFCLTEHIQPHCSQASLL
jgi:hypothetical protein